MNATLNPSDVIEFLMIGAGAILLFKQLADIDRSYEFKLFVITLILSLAVTLFFIGYGLILADWNNVECPDNHYCHTEM
jgi:hypothetical protein